MHGPKHHYIAIIILSKQYLLLAISGKIVIIRLEAHSVHFIKTKLGHSLLTAMFGSQNQSLPLAATGL